MRAPFVFRAGLHDLKAAVDHLQHVARAGSGELLNGQMDRDHASRPHTPQQDRRNFHRHGAVDKQLAVVANGLEEAGIGATGPNRRLDLPAAVEEHRFAAGKIGRHDA